MVEVLADVVLVALKDRLGEVGLAGFGVILVPETVALLVGFGHDIESVSVAKVIPQRIIGIVAGAHRIDVEALHHLDVLYHPLFGEQIAAVGVGLVAVDTLDEHGLAVDKQLAALDFHAAEANVLAGSFIERLAAFVSKPHTLYK